MIEAFVTGNVGKDPESKVSQSGKEMCFFSVASTEKKDGPTTWVRVVCFDEQAALVFERVRKGDRVMLSGRLSVKEFERKDGTKGSSLEMIANEVGVSLRWPRRGEGKPASHTEEVADEDDAEVGPIPF